jgi:hypothetical protein
VNDTTLFLYRKRVLLRVSRYTSLGVGDIYPTAPLRLVIGVEHLIGPAWMLKSANE